MIFVMDTKTIALAFILFLGITLAVAGTYYQTVVLQAFEYYTEEETSLEMTPL